MRPGSNALELAEALERAYRLALAVEALAAERDPAAAGQALSGMTEELLGVLDQARASLLRPGTSGRTGW